MLTPPILARAPYLPPTKQPAGRVTLLFSDIEGSTRLLTDLGAQTYARLLDEHAAVLSTAFASHGGYVVDREGDSFFVAFASAHAAVTAAAEAQAALAAHHWPAGRAVRVRIGLHTGEPAPTPPKYVGLDVHCAARVMSAANGGQVVLTGATRETIGNDFQVAELGAFRLKDLDEPLVLYQLGTEAFPPLRAIAAGNLPTPAGSFVGREQELFDVTRLLLGEARLLTLTGPGGTGKTRLALEAAHALGRRFAYGAFWVDLAALRDPALVMPSAAQAVGSKDDLAGFVGDRKLLVVFDNFEQVVDAAPEVPVLLEACPNVTVLVTSRERLRVRGEVEYAVLPLVEGEAGELFCARSGLSPSAAIDELCERLDCLPLAIELAAAMTDVLSPPDLLGRLEQRLDLFRGGRDALPRQASLRATIAWSYGLLSATEQAAFARLAVFAGRFDAEAAEAVCGVGVDVVAPLVRKALLRARDGRFSMLETIHEFAAERLGEQANTAELRLHHVEHFLALAVQADPELKGPAQLLWFERLSADLDNLRQALSTLLDIGRAEEALALTGYLREFWDMHGLFVEGLDWCDAALRLPCDDPGVRAAAEHTAGLMLVRLGQWLRAEERFERALAGYEAAGNDGGAALAKTGVAFLAMPHDPVRGLRLGREAVATARVQGDPWLLAWALHVFGDCLDDAGDPAGARVANQDSLALFRSVGDARCEVLPLVSLAEGAIVAERLDEAFRYADDALRLGRSLDDHGLVGAVLTARAAALLAAGDLERGSADAEESLRLGWQVRDGVVCVDGLVLLACARVLRGEAICAVRLWSAARRALAELGTANSPAVATLALRHLDPLSEQLGADFELVCEAGSALSLGEAVEFGLTVGGR